MHRERLRREGLVQLDDVDLVERLAGPRVEGLRTAGTGPMPMVVGSTPQTAQDRMLPLHRRAQVRSALFR